MTANIPSLANIAASQLASLERLCHGPCVEPIGAVEHFVLRYMFLESSLRILIQSYREREALAKATSDHLPIRIDVARSALEFYGLQVNPASLDILFDSKKKTRGETNARALRNALVHNWNLQAFDEVQTRTTELIAAISDVTREMSRYVSINQT